MCQISGCSLSCKDGLHAGSYAHGPETRCRPPACNPHSPRRWEVAFVIQLLSTQEPPDRRADMRNCPDNLTASRRGTRGRSRARRRFKRRNMHWFTQPCWVRARCIHAQFLARVGVPQHPQPPRYDHMTSVRAHIHCLTWQGFPHGPRRKTGTDQLWRRPHFVLHVVSSTKQIYRHIHKHTK